MSLRPGFVLERHLNALYGDLRPFWLTDEDLFNMYRKAPRRANKSEAQEPISQHLGLYPANGTNGPRIALEAI